MKKNILITGFACVTIIMLNAAEASAQKQGEEKIDSLLKVLITVKDDTAKVNTFNVLADEFKRSNPDTSIYYANQALQLSTKLNYKTGIADAYLYTGAAKTNLAKYDEALKSSNAALQLYDQVLVSEKTIDKSYILKKKARGINNIGNIYYYQANYPEALKNYLIAIKIGFEIGDKKSIAASYNNIGAIYFYQGNYPDALKSHYTSLKIWEEIADKQGIVNSYNNIGIIYYNQSNYPQALKNYFIALKTGLESGDKKGVALSYNNIGLIYTEQGDYPEALKNHLAALKIRQEIGNKQSIALSYSNIGSIYEHQGNYPEALEHYLTALKTGEEVGDKRGVAAAYNSIGGIYMKQKKNREALAYQNKSLALSKEIGNLDNIKESYRGLSESDSAQGNFNLALEHYKLYITYRDSLFNEANTEKTVQSQMQYEFDKKEALTKAEQEKKDAIALKEIQKQKLVRNSFVSGFAVVLLFAGVFFAQRNKIRKGKVRSDELLLNILPAEVAEELKQKGSAEARQFEEVTVMFTDFKGFTQISEKLSPSELVAEIHTCFKAFDNIITKYNIEKIKTIGDSYMCAGGLPVVNKTNATDVIKAAIEIQQFMQQHLQQRKNENKEVFEIRIGIHTGPVVAGIVGIKKFAYDIWGDSVNIASRMESSGETGKVNISGTTYELVKDKFNCTHRGKIQAKNKGEIDMYFVEQA